MREEQFEDLVQRIKDDLAGFHSNLLGKIQYYGDKGPNMSWYDEHDPNKNAVFIGWIQEQWKNCFARLDEVKGFVRPLQDAHLAEDAFARIRQMLEQGQKNTLGEFLPQFTALADNLEIISSRQETQHSLYEHRLSEMERNLAEEIQAFRQEVNDRKAEADAALNMEVKRLQSSVNFLNEELNAEKRAHDAAKNARLALEQTVKEQEQSLKEQKEQLQTKKTLLQNETEKRQQTEQTLSAQTLANERLSEINAALSNEKQSLEQTRNDLSAQIAQMKDTHAKEQATLHFQMEEAVRAANQETDAARRHADELTAEMQSLKKELQESQAHTAAILRPYDIYRPVLDALQKCGTFLPICEKYGLGKGNETALFTLVQQIGASIEFAKELYDCAVQKKQQTKEPMREAERQVYAALNLCYRAVWNVDFDIYRQPGGQSITEPFQKVKFDFAESRNLVDSRDRTSKFAQELYVPSLSARTGNLYSQAQVKAGNL